MELSGSDVERVHARMKGAEKWHFSLKIAENCRKRLKFITAYARQLLRISRNASVPDLLLVSRQGPRDWVQPG